MRKITARDLMNADVLTVPEDLGIHELSAFLIDNEISGAPVVDTTGKPLGVVSVTDVASVASEDSDVAADRQNPDFYLKDLQEAYNEEEIRDLHLVREGMEVRDIMTPAVYSVGEDSSVSEIATTMLNAHLHRVLVTSGDEVVGIISSSDLLGLLVEEG